MFWIIAIIFVVAAVIFLITEQKYKQLENEVFNELGFSNWNIVPYFDEHVTVKSRQALEKYDDFKFFKENREKLAYAESIIKWKTDVALVLSGFLESNEYESRSQYRRITEHINGLLL